MRLSLRFVLPLLVVLGLLAYFVVPFVDRMNLRWAMRDLDMRAELIAKAVEAPLLDELHSKPGVEPRRLLNQFNRIAEDERLFAIGYCPVNSGDAPVATRRMPAEVKCSDVATRGRVEGRILDGDNGPLHVSITPIASGGAVVLLHDMSFIERRSAETKRYLYYFFIGLAFLVSLITVVVAQLSWRGWVQGLRALMRGEGLLRQPAGFGGAAGSEPVAMTVAENGPELRPELVPIARDLQRMIQDIEADRSARDENQINWGPDALRAILHGELRGEDVIVVSNREPYLHVHHGDSIQVKRPASGLVTALEPIMRACSGTWVAHGSGDADRDTVDGNDHIEVPPERPAYRMRRVWLTPEQEAGYYYGFANEGLWPLCHIAHVRPIFRSSDWQHYVEVNRIFAAAVVQEAKTKDPIVLVQDYHLALVPRMIRDALPEATVITFWHIPWPNPESFAICPWREQIVDGLLGSSIIGFHTQFHCNNFVDTVDRLLEARVDRESFEVTSGGKPTAVRHYPISIDWPPEPELMEKRAEACRVDVRADNNLPPEQLLGIGVDRLDYTKGILERFRAIERLFEMQPEWIGRFTFIQIAAPTRSSIGEYQTHETAVRELTDRINARFGRDGIPAILLKIEHHSPRQVYEHYRASELCFVSSLHDGMNLVAKEFTAAREDEQGVLVLSQFTGASRELPEALIVNPYDADQAAMALHVALTMAPAEQRDRMRSMRGQVSQLNVYRWAGRMLLDAATMRRRTRLLANASALVAATASMSS